MKTNPVSILGCGWLGMALAERLTSKGVVVKASRRKMEDKNVFFEKNIQPFEIEITPGGIKENHNEDFFRSEVLVICMGPGRDEQKNRDFLSGIKILFDRIRGISQTIFISSTSVYPDVNREVTEEEKELPVKNSGKTLLEAEKILMKDPVNACVVRFGGLVGYDRVPGNFLAGKTELKNGNAPVNLIHRDDCVGIIEKLIEKEIRGDIFNACMDKHPLRKDFYRQAAKQAGLPVPEFKNENNSFWKTVNSQKLQKITGYRFRYDDPMEIIPIPD